MKSVFRRLCLVVLRELPAAVLMLWQIAVSFRYLKPKKAVLEAQADSNVNQGDHLDVILTPQEGTITQATTLQY